MMHPVSEHELQHFCNTELNLKYFLLQNNTLMNEDQSQNNNCDTAPWNQFFCFLL